MRRFHLSAEAALDAQIAQMQQSRTALITALGLMQARTTERLDPVPRDTGSGNGFNATGAHLKMRGITIWRVTNGKLSEEWSEFDEHSAAERATRTIRR